jgi:polysaccharide export outer membrane protein
MMMALIRLSAPVFVAALLAACSASVVGDPSSGGPQLAVAQAPSQAKVPATHMPASETQSVALQKVTQAYAMADPKSKAYKIGPLDVLEVNVFKVPELSKSVQVSEAGTINFPLIGEIEAGGKSARELEQELTKRLGAKYLQNPQITVFVKEHNSQRITVTGAVKKPGVIPMAGGVSLLQAIAQGGGLEEVAESTALVLRVSDGQRLAGRYDVADIQAGRAEDPQLQSGDLVIVPTSDMKQGLNTVLRLVPMASLVPLL